MLTKVIEIRAIAPFAIQVTFNDGTSGVHDCSVDIQGSGKMVLPLQEATYFMRVFLEFGAPTWPNGFDMAPEWLQREMRTAGELRAIAAE